MSTSSSSAGAWSPTGSWRPCAPGTPGRPCRVTVLAEEDRAPYDRVGLSAFFSGRDPEDLALGDTRALGRPAGDPAHRGAARSPSTARRARSRPPTVRHVDLRPPRPGHRLLRLGAAGARRGPGRGASSTARSTTSSRCVTGSRTRDVELGRPVRGAVIGGGLLGLEAAGALAALGASCTVVEFAPRLMAAAGRRGRWRGAAPAHRGARRRRARSARHRESIQADGGGRVRRAAHSGDEVPTPCRSTSWCSPPACGRATSSPRDAGLAIGARGGVVVDEACRTRRPAASGRSARSRCIGGRCLGLVAPGLRDGRGRRRPRCSAATATFPGADTVHQAQAARRRRRQLRRRLRRRRRVPSSSSTPTPSPGVYKKLVVTDDARTLLGGVLVGDASATRSLRPMVGGRARRPTRAAVPAARGAGADAPDASCRTRPRVCSCNNVTAGADPRRGRPSTGCTRRRRRSRRARGPAPRCGSCLPLVKKLIGTELARAGVTVVARRCASTSPCRGPSCSTSSRVSGLRDASARSSRGYGTGRRLRHLQAGGRLDPRHAATTGTSSTARPGRAAGHQRPRPGQHPEGRHLLGRPAHPGRRDHAREADRHRRRWPSDFGLYTKITGGQRIDLFGARLEQLPGDLAAAGRRRVRVRPRLRQVAAHGEVVRRLDLVPVRRAGLGRHGDRCSSCATAGCARPHKLKLGVSRLRPRVRRGPRQGRRRHRHREGLEPLRRRQRRLHPAARRAARRGPRRRDR